MLNKLIASFIRSLIQLFVLSSFSEKKGKDATAIWARNIEYKSYEKKNNTNNKLGHNFREINTNLYLIIP
jgi:hypothetical protein